MDADVKARYALGDMIEIIGHGKLTFNVYDPVPKACTPFRFYIMTALRMEGLSPIELEGLFAAKCGGKNGTAYHIEVRRVQA